MREAVGNELDPSRRRVHSTAYLQGQLSRDGRSILVVRPGSRPGVQRVSILPFAGGAEVTIAEGDISAQGWTGGGDVLIAESAPTGVRVIQVHPSSKQRRQLAIVRDVSLQSIDLLADGRLLWVPNEHHPIRVAVVGDSARSIELPSWLSVISNLDASPDGKRVVVSGWNPALDTLVIATLNLDDATWARHWSGFVEYGGVRWQRDGSVLVYLNPTRLFTELHRLRPGAGMIRLGTIPGLTVSADVSADGSAVLVTTSEYKGDVWIGRLGEPR
jgi:hypothetical protein